MAKSKLLKSVKQKVSDQFDAILKDIMHAQEAELICDDKALLLQNLHRKLDIINKKK